VEPDVELPTLLDFPAPRLRGYSRESAVAEKLNAMFKHGRLNIRMKDYFDILLLEEHFAFDGSKLAEAIRATIRTPRDSATGRTGRTHRRVRRAAGQAGAVDRVPAQDPRDRCTGATR